MSNAESTVTISSPGHPSQIDRELFSRAASLVNPKSGIANDYLNIFYELLLLVENLPVIPEMIDDVVNWQPVSYSDYFQRSRLPGSAAALAIHQQLSRELRESFDRMVQNINEVALAGIRQIETHRKPNGEIYPDDVIELCERLSSELKACLAPTTYLVNNGLEAGGEQAQSMVDRLMDETSGASA